MKKALLLVFGLLMAVGFAAADPAEGYWASVDDESGDVTAYWHIYETGGELRGEIVKVPGQSDLTLASAAESSYDGHPYSGDLSEHTVIDVPWIWGMEKKRTGEWKGGNIVDVSDGSKYSCKITFHEEGSKVKTGTFSSMKVDVDTLEMRGSIGPFGRSQYWEKVSKSDIPE